MASVRQQYIGSYRLLNVLMTGQTSQVWEVIQDDARQRYALKMLLTDYRRSREHIGLLKHEYAVGSKCVHPHVIRMHEVSTSGGIPFVVMELFPHPNLKQFINRGVEQLAYYVPKIIGQAAAGLAYFNEQGWVHRDVKPDNFLVSRTGEVKLIDFALAVKAKAGLSRLFGGTSKIQGTRSYMSPEQIRGRPLDQRADVYSFGCMVHELVAGKPPFTGVSSDELLNKHLRAAAPSLEAVAQNVTPEFAALVRRTLAKKPEDRPDSMSQFLQEFGTIRVFIKPPRKPRPEAAQQDTG